MFIKRNSRRVGSKTYVNHLLVESIATPAGPRHRTICSLGSLALAPEAQWRGLAQKLASALGGQTTFLPDPAVAAVAARAHPPRGRPRPTAAVGADMVAAHTDQVETEDPRKAGPVHVGHQLWRALELDRILAEAGLSARAQRLTEIMTLNRLVHPASEHAMPDWIRRTALADILGADFGTLSDEALYRNLDRLHPQRVPIERALAARERTLFNLDDTLYLYDVTSTYVEGQCRLQDLLRLGGLAEADEGLGPRRLDVGEGAGLGQGVQDGLRVLGLGPAEEGRRPDVLPQHVPGLPLEDLLGLVLGLFPRADLHRRSAEIRGDRHGVGRQLLRAPELAHGVEEPVLAGIGPADGVERGNEVLVDLERVPQLDDRLVELSLLEIPLAAAEGLLLPDLRAVAARSAGDEQEKEDDPGKRLPWCHVS